MSFNQKRTNRGFTLIELLIVVAIIGIIAAVAIPNLLQALETARQKKSFADLRTIAIALAVYNNDHSHYPALGDTNHMALVPFLGDLPTADGWRTLFGYQCSGTGTRYTVVSYGNNREADLPYVLGPITRFQDDIVFIDSQLVQWPEGTQEY
ncbi:MAG: hypothetical protein DRJ65_10730 [Acidobacteria bacterium]|nr:MAG: hypothetical protein DRJ65_10730 [Acidobacteriota bacterium]